SCCDDSPRCQRYSSGSTCPSQSSQWRMPNSCMATMASGNARSRRLYVCRPTITSVAHEISLASTPLPVTHAPASPKTARFAQVLLDMLLVLSIVLIDYFVYGKYGVVEEAFSKISTIFRMSSGWSSARLRVSPGSVSRSYNSIGALAFSYRLCCTAFHLPYRAARFSSQLRGNLFCGLFQS